MISKMDQVSLIYFQSLNIKVYYLIYIIFEVYISVKSEYYSVKINF
jgi:hypothetical protein